jgi:O-6-methylguanine DNA methyltransferase
MINILKSNVLKTFLKIKAEMDKQKIHYAKMKTPFGIHLWLAQSGRGVCWIEFGNSEKEFLKQLSRHWPKMSFVENSAALQKPITELSEYFAGRRKKFSFKLAPEGTAFQQKVWQAVSEVPFGQVTTYQNIARKIHKTPAVRAVGHANGRNPLPVVIPCHRVIGSNGDLCGYGGGIDLKVKLLALEGILLAA